uniref:SpdD-like protein n=1 Tax=Streptomyces sp. NBC_01401 TaxID=2903854 RepID=A0AAU3H063_9ACTN
MHEPTYEITTLTPQQPTRHPAMLPTEIPPGVQMVTLPGGIRTLAYTPTQTPPPPPVPVSQPIPTWAKTTALLTPTIGGGIAAAGIGLSYAAPGLIAMSQALWASVALIAAAAIGVPMLLRLGRSAPGTGRGTTHITQNITSSGMFGKANGTINHH